MQTALMQGGKNANANGKKEKHKVFGASLDSLSTEIPYIMEICIMYLDEFGLDLEGIFRKSGSLTTVNEYRARFEKGIYTLPRMDTYSYTYGHVIDTNIYVLYFI